MCQHKSSKFVSVSLPYSLDMSVIHQSRLLPRQKDGDERKNRIKLKTSGMWPIQRGPPICLTDNYIKSPLEPNYCFKFTARLTFEVTLTDFIGIKSNSIKSVSFEIWKGLIMMDWVQ